MGHSKEKLIVDALASLCGKQPLQYQSGSLRADLISMARYILDGYFERRGLVVLRAQVEAKVYPELFGQALERHQRESMRIGRSIVVSGIDSGELPQGTSPALVLDAVAGILTNHVLSTPISQMPALMERRDKYVEETVDFVLSAVGYRPADQNA
ncbi:TetR-like C-terminal domain-containing protein [Streptosporangium sp. NPDC002607]